MKTVVALGLVLLAVGCSSSEEASNADEASGALAGATTEPAARTPIDHIECRLVTEGVQESACEPVSLPRPRPAPSISGSPVASANCPKISVTWMADRAGVQYFHLTQSNERDVMIGYAELRLLKGAIPESFRLGLTRAKDDSAETPTLARITAECSTK